MGTWGTGPFENDTALDFLRSFRRSRKSSRIAAAEAALRAYLSFDQRLQSGENVSSLDQAAIEELRSSRATTLDWYSSIGEPPPIDVFPELATEESWEAHVQELAAPRVEDGSCEAFCAIAIAHIVAEAIETGGGPLGGSEQKLLGQLAMLCSEVLLRILRNEVFRSTWSVDDYARLAASLEERAFRLRAVA